MEIKLPNLFAALDANHDDVISGDEQLPLNSKQPLIMTSEQDLVDYLLKTGVPEYSLARMEKSASELTKGQLSVGQRAARIGAAVLLGAFGVATLPLLVVGLTIPILLVFVPVFSVGLRALGGMGEALNEAVSGKEIGADLRRPMLLTDVFVQVDSWRRQKEIDEANTPAAVSANENVAISSATFETS